MDEADRIASPWFWEIVDEVRGDPEELRRRLMTMSRDEIAWFEDQFQEAAAELKGPELEERFDNSEDTMDDVAAWLVTQGKAVYSAALERLPDISEEKEEEIRSTPTLAYVAAEVYRERFGETPA